MTRRNSLLRGVQEFEEEKTWGKKCFTQKDYRAAAGHYTNCIEIARAKKKEEESARAEIISDRDLAAAHSNRAEALLQMNEFQMALLDCTKSLQLDPQNLKALYRKGRALQGLQDFTEARSVLQQAFNLCPASQEIITAMQHCNAAYAKARLGNYDVSHFLHGGRRRRRQDLCPPPPVDDVIGDVEIRKTKDGRGWGLFATKYVSAGELILVSNPVAVARGEVAADELHEQLLLAVIAAAEKSPDLAWRLYALDDGSQHNHHNQDRVVTPHVSLFQAGSCRPVDFYRTRTRIREVVRRNALRGEVTAAGLNDGTVFCGLWLLPSFVNNSCVPNCGRLTVGNAMYLHAAKEISKGEEITICYCDALLPQPARQVRFDAACFNCICRRCSFEKSMCSLLKPLYAEFEGLYEKALEEASLARSEGREFPTELPKCAEFGDLYSRFEQVLRKQSKLKEEEKKWLRSSFVCAYLAGIQSEEFIPRSLEDPFPARFDIMQAIQSTVPGDVRTLVMAANEMKDMKSFAGESEEWAVNFSEIQAWNACIRCYGDHREEAIQELVSSHANCHVF